MQTLETAVRTRSNVFLSGGGEECKSEATAQRQSGRERRLHTTLCNISTPALLRLISPDPLGRIRSQLEQASSHLSDGPGVKERRAAVTRPPPALTHPPCCGFTRGRKNGSESLRIKKCIIMHNKKTPALVYINTALTEYPFPNSPSGSHRQQSSILNIWLPPRPPGRSGLGGGGRGGGGGARAGRALGGCVFGEGG